MSRTQKIPFILTLVAVEETGSCLRRQEKEGQEFCVIIEMRGMKYLDIWGFPLFRVVIVWTGRT